MPARVERPSHRALRPRFVGVARIARGCSGGLAGAAVRMTSNARADGATPSVIIVRRDNNQSHPAVAIDCGGASSESDEMLLLCFGSESQDGI